MKKIVRFVASLLIVSLVMSLAACAPGGIVMSSETPEPTLTAIPTLTPTATPSPTPTVEPTPTPTPQKREAKAGIKKGQDKVEAEVNQRFQDFLNGTGEFTDEKIREKAFRSMFTDVDEVLGCLYGSFDYNSFEVQGVLLYYQAIEQSEIFAFGTKNKRGERVISLLEFPSQAFLDYQGEFYIPTYDSYDTYGGDTLHRFDYRGKGGPYYDYLDKYIGSPLWTSIGVLPAAEDPTFEEQKASWKEAWQSIEQKISINNLFLTNIYYIDDSFRDFYKLNMDDRTKKLYESEAYPIITVNTLAEFEDQVANNYDSIPNCYYILTIALD